MIKIYSGMPGSGKSYALTYEAYQHMKRGRKVYSNFYIRGANKITFEDLISYVFPAGSVVLIDEAGRWFNSRKWKDLPDEVFDLFTMHRHMELDLIVAVQNFQRIDVALREVVELCYWSKNIPFVPYFIYYGYYDVEQLGMKGNYDFKKRFWKKKKVYRLYDTHAMKSEFQKALIPDRQWETVDEEKLSLWDWIRGRYMKDESNRTRKVDVQTETDGG